MGEGEGTGSCRCSGSQGPPEVGCLLRSGMREEGYLR